MPSTGPFVMNVRPAARPASHVRYENSPTVTYTRLLEQTNQSEPVDAGSRMPQLRSAYQRSYSGSIQYGSNRFSPSSLPNAAAMGASMPLPLWHHNTRPPCARAVSQASTSGG